MKNLIIDTYISWLENFIKEGRGSTDQAGKLKIALAKVSSLQELHDTLTQYYTGIQKSSDDLSSLFAHGTFSTKVKEWLLDAEEWLSSLSDLKKKLDITVSDNSASLLKLLQKILSDDLCLLHCMAPSILALNDFDPLTILNYLANLPESPFQKGEKGTFAAMEPVDDDHFACIKLLYNVSVSKIQGNNWEIANGLLQNSLSIYQDRYTLEKPKSEPEPYSYLSYCAIF